ncbi:MAG: thioredoxin family protein [Syntrophobacteraceae bacterium]
MKKSFRISPLIGTMVFVGMLFWGAGSCFADQAPAAVPQVPAKGMVTMVDLGASGCIPCNIMSGIVDSLQKQYKGKAAIYFINIRNHPEEGHKFGISVIPTQIFYDKNGKEVYRHEGVMLEGAVIAKLQSLGVK